MGLHIVQISSFTAISSTPTPSQPASSHGLSTSGKAGIGIAGGVLLFALGGALGYIIRLRRKRKLRTGLDNELPEYKDKLGTPSTHEVIPSRSELPTSKEALELPVGREVHELYT